MRHLQSLKGRVADGRCVRCKLAATVLLGLCLGLGFGPGLSAETFNAGGLTFSDELGGFRLLSATGLGTASDPIILVEEITSLNPAVLVVRQDDVKTSRSPSDGVLLRSLIKIVVNRSAWRWSGFELELRGDSGRASVYSDGLSFDQLRAIRTPVRSDVFAAVRTEDEPHDRLRYDQGHVEPDQSVRFAFNLIDLNPRSLFYLAQAPIILLTDLPDGKDQVRSLHAAAFGRPNLASSRDFRMPISP